MKNDYLFFVKDVTVNLMKKQIVNGQKSLVSILKRVVRLNFDSLIYNFKVIYFAVFFLYKTHNHNS